MNANWAVGRATPISECKKMAVVQRGRARFLALSPASCPRRPGEGLGLIFGGKMLPVEQESAGKTF
jgi:hypothetical protein